MARMKARGFSLLELIVGIALLGLLAQLLLPTLRRNVSCGRRSQCASNMSQLGKAMIMYSQVPGNGNMFPSRSSDKSDPEKDGDTQEALSLLYKGYVSDVRVFKCHSDKSAPTQSELCAVAPTTKNVFQSGGFSETGVATSFSYSQGKNPDDSMVVILADKVVGTQCNSNNHGPQAGQNVLLAGGSVEFRDNPRNNIGKDDDGQIMEDSDIFSNAPAPNVPKELNSYCKPLAIPAAVK